MKKLSIIWAMCIMAAVLTITSCAHRSGRGQDTDSVAVAITADDVAYVKACLEKMSDVRYSDKESFVASVITEQNKSEEDSIIQHVPIRDLERIINVVHAKYGYITRKLVVTEYKESYDKVYKYLDATEMTNVKPDSTDYEREQSIGNHVPGK